MKRNPISFRIKDVSHKSVRANGSFGHQDLSTGIFHFSQCDSQIRLGVKVNDRSFCSRFKSFSLNQTTTNLAVCCFSRENNVFVIRMRQLMAFCLQNEHHGRAASFEKTDTVIYPLSSSKGCRARSKIASCIGLYKGCVSLLIDAVFVLS